MKRAIGIMCLLILPAFGPGALSLMIAVVSAITAYQGFRANMVYGMVAIFLGVELLYGFDIGTLSLSYLTAALIITVVRRFVTIPAWAARRGWRPLDGVQAVIVAYALFWMVQMGNLLIEHFVYGYGQLSQRFLLMASGSGMQWALVVIVGMLIVLRRIDEPFRHPIHFGT